MKTYYDFILENNENDYDDYEITITYFWMCSYYSKWNKFNFEKAFESFKYPIWSKLAIHGLLEYDDFKEVEEEYMDQFNINLSELVVHTDYVSFTENDIKDAILKKKYEIFEDAFSALDSLIELENIYDEMQKSNNLGLQEKIQLFDKVIHAQHETGDIFDDIDIEGLRNEFERDMEKM